MADPVAGGHPAARLTGVDVEIERVPVLRGLDLTVAAGERLGVLGANGTGKTTLLRVLATLVAPSAGHGEVLGARLGTPACAAIAPRIALIAHEPALYPKLSLRENLHFVARLTGISPTAADDALDRVGLARAADRRAEVCSQGMRRRAELARVLFSTPSLLLLDEAHAGLDAASAGLVEAAAEQVCRRGGASVAVAHDHQRLAAMSDRVVEITAGRAVAMPREMAV
ncbi:ABC transporter ATP-binding protein [Haloechinothrix sp. LS1_15]|uniref:ABC transporter ATP-binding protein n=1 Tax=Haloechinothrix sp. LS1_15 TaxID=2652248 RepID=UPI002947BE5D|nr:ABC transporter ATP-binding protein [Haloechinothrix sp. LS1_15]MDV6011858.1 ABC transporter ATP-binding protein [Haloechinothrix sp. LS1_15]